MTDNAKKQHLPHSHNVEHPVFTRREEGHLKRLEARMTVLTERLKSAVGSAARDATQELRAIGWATDTVKILLTEAREGQPAGPAGRDAPMVNGFCPDREKCLKDAARYRWIRTRGLTIFDRAAKPEDMKLDNYIDAEMERQCATEGVGKG